MNSFFDLGFGFYFQREAWTEDIKEKLESAISFRLIVMVLFIAVLFIYLYLSLSIDPIIIGIIGLLTYLNGFNIILNSVLYGKKKYKKSFMGFLLSRILFALLNRHILPDESSALPDPDVIIDIYIISFRDIIQIFT